MPLNLDAALQTFIAEARELLQEMEQALLHLEGEPGDGQAMDAVFRAAHTIKGSAGLFGLDALVGFAHVVEDLLDRLRGGSLAVNRERIALMLACNDHLGTLLEQVAVRRAAPTEAMQAIEAELRQRLLAAGAGAGTGTGAGTASTVEAGPGGSPAQRLWHVSARFGQDTFRHGMDPLSFLRYLDSLGERQAVLIDDHAIAHAPDFDPETCLLGFHLRLRADCEASVLRDAFAFVEEESDIAIFDLTDPANTFSQWLAQWPTERAQWLSDGLGEVTAQHTPPAPEAPAAQPQEPARAAAAATPAPAAAPAAAISDGRQAWVRVRADKLETLINLAGELVTAGAGARLLAEQSADESLIEASTAITNLVEAVLESTLAMRMVPIGETFNRFHRTVRDVSQALGKDIELVVSGGDTELDKALVEQLSDPLMHLLRNAMDHGIEPPEQRLAAGKPACGRLQLNAFHDAGNIVVELSDDGAGLNRERILAKARERGLVGAVEPADRELLALIFEPGFSTAAAVTNLSGRGVGMDVVKRNITGLRGHIELLSPPGQGTTVRIRLPLTLAMIDGLLVEAAGSSYVLPLGMVRECMEIRPEQRQQVRAKGHVDLRGEVLPVVFLRDHFGLQGATPKRENIVVIQAQGIKAGLVVDNLLGEYQTVIKPLGQMFSGVKGISGSSVLGSGVVALILDAPALLKDLIERGSTLAHSPSLYSLSA